MSPLSVPPTKLVQPGETVLIRKTLVWTVIQKSGTRLVFLFGIHSSLNEVETRQECVFSSWVDFPEPFSSCHKLVERGRLSFSSMFKDSYRSSSSSPWRLLPLELTWAQKASKHKKVTVCKCAAQRRWWRVCVFDSFHSTWGNTLFMHPQCDRQLVFFPPFLAIFCTDRSANEQKPFVYLITLVHSHTRIGCLEEFRGHFTAA